MLIYSQTRTNSPKPPPDTILLTSLYKSPPPLASHTLFTYSSNNGSLDPTKTARPRPLSLSAIILPTHLPSCSLFPPLFPFNHQSIPPSARMRLQRSPTRNTHHTPPRPTFPLTSNRSTPTFTPPPARPISSLLPGDLPLGFGAPSAKNGAEPHHHHSITKTSTKPSSTITPSPHVNLASNILMVPSLPQSHLVHANGTQEKPTRPSQTLSPTLATS